MIDARAAQPLCRLLERRGTEAGGGRLKDRQTDAKPHRQPETHTFS